MLDANVTETGDLDRKGGMGSIRSTGSTSSWMSSESNYAGASVMSEGSNQSFALEDEQLDASVTETYMGEWKNDKRCGFGISERSDGLKYEVEWYNNRKYGYGITTHGGVREDGKYKNNVLVTSNQKRHLFLVRSAKFRERIDSALNAAQRASKIALQKADIAISRTATARGKAEQADIASMHAREDAQIAKECSLEYGAVASVPSPSNEANDPTKLSLSPTTQLGSSQRLKNPEPTNQSSNLTPTRRSPMPTSNSFGAGAVNSKNIHSPSTYNSESVTLTQSLPQKPSLSPQQGGGSNLSAAAQSQTNTRGAMGGPTQSASNSNRKITPQLNAPAMPSPQP